MPISEYVLLALLTSTSPQGQVEGTLTLGPEVVVQPNGGTTTVIAKKKEGEPKKDSARKKKGDG
jgi:hypothetical protein